MLTLFELFGAVFLFIWCGNGVPTPNQIHGPPVKNAGLKPLRLLLLSLNCGNTLRMGRHEKSKHD